jgi:hypothetical protein
VIIARQKAELHFAAVIVVFGVLTGIVYQAELWNLDANGFSALSLRLPFWDFTNLWAGSVLALKGQVLDLFNVDAYRADLRQMFGPLLPDQEWSYPPSILLLGFPLAELPIGWAYAIWTLGTFAVFYWALRSLGFPTPIRLLLLICPAAWMNSIFGQNGALTAALLLGGLALAPKRPLVSGILFGLLTIKPHLGLLIPVCLLASKNYRAFCSAVVTTGLLLVTTSLLFAYDVWILFLTKTGPLMATIMEAHYPQPYHKNAITGFIFARWIGFDVFGAYAIQGLLFLAAAVTTIWLWRPSTEMDHIRRVCLTAVLAIIATPYGYSYDTIPLCVATAFLFLTEPRLNRNFLAVVYLWPLFLHILNALGIGISIAVPIALVATALWLQIKDRSTQTSTA